MEQLALDSRRRRQGKQKKKEKHNSAMALFTLDGM